jgi:LemA protein
LDFIIGLFQFALFVAVVLAVIGFLSYNKLQELAQEVKEKASNVQIAVAKKLSLINQMIDIVKNYQEAEQFTYLKISQDTNTAAMMQAYSQSGVLLTSLQGLADRFPNLKASEQYHRLGNNIERCESEIQEGRQRYNAAVKGYNAKRLSIPTIFVARFMGFGEAPYLEFDLSSAKDVTSLKEFKTDDGERLQQLLTGAGTQLAGAKLIANQAGQLGKALTDRVIDRGETEIKKYFYMNPGATPNGPVVMDQLQALFASGGINEETVVAEVGSQTWVAYRDWAIHAAQ